MLKIVISLLTIPVLVLAAGPVLKTGQTQSHDASGTVVTDGSIKDDGYYQAGETRSYSRSFYVVTDNVTGLQWQDNVDSVDKLWVTLSNFNAGHYYDTSGDTAATYCTNLDLDPDNGGWRLPRIQELQTLIDGSQYNPAVTPGVFSHINPGVSYWSYNTLASDPGNALDVDFYDGDTGSWYKNTNGWIIARYVRCVRGGPVTPSPGFSRSGDIVTDSTTGLQWQDDWWVIIKKPTWEGAIDFCENFVTLGGHNDWRLPNKNELLSVVDYTRSNPSINTIFHNAAPEPHWSSTTSSYNTLKAEIVEFDDGYAYGNPKSNYNYVRCVRGGQVNNSNFLPSVMMYLLN